MTDEVVPAAKKSKWKQAAILLISGVVLGGGGCAAFLSGISRGSMDPLVEIGGFVFVLGVLLFLAGIVEVLIRLARSSAGK